MKNIVLFITFILCLIFTSFIKNNTRFIEKQIVILDKEINILNKKLNEAKLEHEYLITPEKLSILSSKYLSETLTYYNREDVKTYSNN